MERSASRREGPAPSKADLVLASYLGDGETGVTSAIYDALRSLFTEAELPDNPFRYLAAALVAHVDQAPLWREPDAALLTAIDSAAGGVQVLDAAAGLCGLACCSHTWGLPHVLRLAACEAAVVLSDILTNGLPDSFFPGPAASSAGDGCTIQVLSSIQGSTALWHPRWLELPELTVRADVIVRGPRADDAPAHLADLIQSDLADLADAPVYFVDRLTVVDPAAERAGGAAAAVSLPSLTLEEVLADPAGFRATLQRHVLAGCCLELRAVLMLEAPQDAQNIDVRRLRFESATKRYFLHYVYSEAESEGTTTGDTGGLAAAATAAGKKGPSGGRWGRARGPADRARGGTPPPMLGTQALLREKGAHFGGTAPYEALFEGYFLEPAAAKQYIGLYKKESGEPYSKPCRHANITRMVALVEASLRNGATMDAVRRALLLVMLQDPLPAAPGPLQPEALLPLEDLLAPQPKPNELSMMMGTVPSLVRMMNSGPAIIQGVVREIQAVLVVARLWPLKRREMVERGRAAAAADSKVPAAALSQAQQQSVVSRRATQLQLISRRASSTYEGEEDIAIARLAWLQGFQMEAKLLEQLLELAPRVRACCGGVMLSGLSSVVDALVSRLPAVVPTLPEECAAAIAAAEPNILALQRLLEVAELTLADGLFDRCRGAVWALHRFGIRLAESLMARAVTSAAAEDGDWVAPEWVLDVRFVTAARVRSGAVPQRVAEEGVMLQYAVDTRLDELLSTAFTELTTPPLALNPFPRLVNLLRAQAARLDLWLDGAREFRSSTVNRLTAPAPPSFLYEARPPPMQGPGRNRRGGGRRAAGSGDEDEGSDGGGGGGGGSGVAFGCYAAVTLCDCRAVAALRESLGPLLTERSWQEGSYRIDVVPSLTGDVAISGALRLWDGDACCSQWGTGGGDPGSSGAANAAAGRSNRPPYEHPRFAGVDSEEHHLVDGPSAASAAALFARGVVAQALALHRSSLHLVAGLDCVYPAGRAAGGPRSASSAAGTRAGGRSSCWEGGAGREDSEQSGGAGGPWETFGLERLLADGSAEAAAKALAAAARRLPPGACVGRLRLYAAVKEGSYVPLVRRLCFQHKGVTAALEGPSSGIRAPRLGLSAAAGSPEAEQSSSSNGTDPAEQPWGPAVYRRVFVSRAHAAAWWRGWNDVRGDPAHPFHVAEVTETLQQQVLDAEREGRLLDALKLLLLAGAALRDPDLMLHASRVAHSAAQELWCLQRANAALTELTAADAPSELRAKWDPERVRSLLLRYCGRARRAFASPRLCPFSGFAAAAPRVVLLLRDKLLASGFRADEEASDALRTLRLWTRCCEVAAAAAVHGCLPELLRHGLVVRGGAGGKSYGNGLTEHWE